MGCGPSCCTSQMLMTLRSPTCWIFTEREGPGGRQGWGLEGSSGRGLTKGPIGKMGAGLRQGSRAELRGSLWGGIYTGPGGGA